MPQHRVLLEQILRLAAVLVILVGALASPRLAEARERVRFDERLERGAILVRTGERRLYLSLGDGTAIRYRVAVGKPGKQWFGRGFVDGKHVRPAWSPPREVKRDHPHLPDVIPGGSPHNPMGERALTIGPGEDYAIHGTNRPGSIGRFASYGCIRMHNADIIDLYERVAIGAAVVVEP
jgi:lipoprotein-anchoring transpeptidase ErfK/SrfK